MTKPTPLILDVRWNTTEEFQATVTVPADEVEKFREDPGHWVENHILENKLEALTSHAYLGITHRSANWEEVPLPKQ